MKRLDSDRGVTLVETLVAVAIALIGVFSMGSLVFQASATTKNQGSETTRAVIYAQDKMEKILSLASVPTTGGQPDWAACTALTPPPKCNVTGVTSTSGWSTGLLAGGATAPIQQNCPTTGPSEGYMDFLDNTGAQFDACATANASVVSSYVRQWKITDLSASTTPAALVGGPVAKQITVAVYSLAAVNTNGGKPVVILTSLVSNPN
jgi:Tfp pilus assembly protein PilV